MEQAKALHSQAEQAREQGNFIEALVLCDRAMTAYISEDNLAGFAEVQASRFLTLRHLYEATENKAYLVLAKYHAQAAVELAHLSGDRSAAVIPLFNLAKAQETLGEFSNAIESYQATLKVMETNPPAAHDRPGVLADMKIHLAVCELKNGDKSALERATVAIADLEASDEMKYNKDVWLSGAYLKLAEALFEIDRIEAKNHLDEAKAVIDSNPELTLREKQWQKLAEKF